MHTVAPLFDAYRQFYGLPADLPLSACFIGERLRRDESVILLAEACADADPDAFACGAPVDGAARGFCQLYPGFCSLQAAPICTLYDLFVAPAGRRAGVGRQLLRAAEAWARQQGIVRLDLTTARDNLPAQALYASLGWQRDDVFRTYSLATGA